MREHWSSSDVVAWTDHDGPGRPAEGPPDAWYRGLATAFGAWFVLAVVGCELIHHSGSEHVPISPLETIGGTAVLLGLPAMVVLLARREVAGAWLAAALGAGACAVSLTQWDLAPVYTAIEAGGFALLGMAGLVLAVAQVRARRAATVVAGGPAEPVRPLAPTAADASTPVAASSGVTAGDTPIGEPATRR
jgi:hypothetical protein